MAESFQKFPSTPHLAWFGQADVRDDKVMFGEEVTGFLKGNIVVEEKVDGANLGIFFDAKGALSFQNRGNLLQGKFTGQWERLRGWASKIEEALRINLPKNHTLFGEWCYARHSLEYNRLPDWFLGFDIFDKHEAKFWSTLRREKVLQAIGITSVPQIGHGHFSLNALKDFLETKSTLAVNEMVEGIYLRRENQNWLEARCKLVRPTFQQAIAHHWSSLPLERNRLMIP